MTAGRHSARPHIGIVAGTADGAALCYRTICHEGARLLREPEVTMHTIPLRLYLEAIQRDDWHGVGALLSQSAAVLSEIGADVIVCPNNTLHEAFEHVSSPVPWLHIADVVIDEARRRRHSRVGLIGTQTVLRGSSYLPRLSAQGLEVILPEDGERSRIQHIIRNELITGQATSRSRAFVQQVIAKMAVKGADAVILACTELPILLDDHSPAVPVLDSTRLLAQAALTRVMAPERLELRAIPRSTAAKPPILYSSP